MSAIKIHQIDGEMKAPRYITTKLPHNNINSANHAYSRLCVCQVQYLKGLACEILQYSVVCWVNVWPLPAAASARYRYLCQHSSKSIRNEWHETLALTLNALIVYNILWEAFGGGVSCGMSNFFEHALILL